MGKYLATINQPEARFGKVVELDDADPSVQQRAAHGFLVPHDAVAKAAQAAPITVGATVTSSKEDIMKAILAARNAQGTTEEGASVSTAVTEASEDD